MSFLEGLVTVKKLRPYCIEDLLDDPTTWMQLITGCLKLCKVVFIQSCLLLNLAPSSYVQGRGHGFELTRCRLILKCLKNRFYRGA